VLGPRIDRRTERLEPNAPHICDESYLNKYGYIRSTYSTQSVQNLFLHVQERTANPDIVFE